MGWMVRTAVCAGVLGCTSGSPTYWQDVQPLLEGRCVSCHQAGSIAPFPLDSYAAVVDRLALVEASVMLGSMPPWKAVSGHLDYARDPSLTPDQVALLSEWVADGAPEGDPSNPGTPVAPLGLELPRVDRTLSMAEPYAPSSSEPDDYRCFLVDWPEVEDRFVTGFEVTPGNPTVVHHVAAFLVSPDTIAGPGVVDQFRGYDAAEEGQGYTCFGGPSGENASQVPAQQIAQWVPGNGAVLFPEGTGIRVPEGSLIVLQVHYSTEAWDGTPDQTAIDVVIEPTVERKGAFAPYLNPLWPMAGMPIPADTEYTHTHSGDPVPFFELMNGDIDLSSGFQIHSAMLHMHLSGQSGLVRLDRVDGSSQVILEVEPWDFDWQINYALAEPLDVQPGDGLFMSCTWDNQTGSALNWGEGSGDEMCVANLFITEP